MGKYTREAIEHQLAVFKAMSDAELARASQPGKDGKSAMQKFNAAERAKDAEAKAAILAEFPGASGDDWFGIKTPYDEVSPGAFATFMYLVKCANDKTPNDSEYRPGNVVGNATEWKAFPSERTIAAQQRVHVRTVRNHLRELEGKKDDEADEDSKTHYIEWNGEWTGSGQNQAKVYVIHETFTKESIDRLGPDMWRRFVTAEVARVKYLRDINLKALETTPESQKTGKQRKVNALIKRAAEAEAYLAELTGEADAAATATDSVDYTFSPDDVYDQDTPDDYDDNEAEETGWNGTLNRQSTLGPDSEFDYEQGVKAHQAKVGL